MAEGCLVLPGQALIPAYLSLLVVSGTRCTIQVQIQQFILFLHIFLLFLGRR